MASKRTKRLSELQSSELGPSEKGLAEEDEHDFNLNGKLSMAMEGDLKNFEKEYEGNQLGTSVGTTPVHSTDSSEEISDGSFENVVPPTNSISRGLSISVIRQRTVNIKFDIVDTRIAGHRHKYVLYILVVTKAPGIDRDKAVIERRYSEFYKLYKELKKIFPDFIKSTEFPDKKLYGNLDSGLIRTRCQILQQFMQKAYENQDIRNSDTFKKFFYVLSLQKGCQYICGGQFDEALTFLLNGLHLQQKLDLDLKKEVIATLCNIVECYMSLENYDEVVKYSMAALEMIDDNISNVYLMPVLLTLKDASVILGKNTDETERKIKEIINLNQIEVEHLPSLRELAVKRFIKK